MAIVFVPGCVALTWWQASRALGGNTLSWAYTFEWPIFGAYAVFMWWKLLHEPDPGAGATLEPADPPAASRVPALPHGGAPTDGAPTDGAPTDGAALTGGGRNGGQDDELEAYNRYLADLNASGRQKRW